MEINIGQKYWIKEEGFENCFGWVPEMDKYAGTQVTVQRSFTCNGNKGYFVEEDREGFLWSAECFCEEQPASDEECEKASLNDFLGEFTVK